MHEIRRSKDGITGIGVGSRVGSGVWSRNMD